MEQTYGLDEVHMDPNIYKDPLKWDPSRYYPERSEDKKIPYSYLGWGGGLHPCVGSRVRPSPHEPLPPFVVEHDANSL